jgi:hypothetical protein
LGYAGERARGASNSLAALNKIPSKVEDIQKSIQKQESIYSSAIRQQQDLLNEYMADVEWLGGHDTATVDAALELESGVMNTPTFDKARGQAKADMERSIKRLASDIRAQRQKQLTRDAVIARRSD